MSVRVKKTHLKNPHGKPRRHAAPKAKTTRKRVSETRKKRATHRKRNPSQLLTLGFLNPTHRRRTVKKHNKKSRAKHRKNPFRFHAKVARHRRRRNPSIIGRSTGLLKTGLLALLGLIVTRQLPQVLLGQRNTGVLGYAANFVTALVAAAAAGRTIGKESGQAVAIGGMLYLVNRALTENFSPIGRWASLSGVGDAAAAGGLGRIQPGYSPVPVVRGPDGQPIIPAALQPSVVPAPAGVSGLRAVAGRWR